MRSVLKNRIGRVTCFALLFSLSAAEALAEESASKTFFLEWRNRDGSSSRSVEILPSAANGDFKIRYRGVERGKSIDRTKEFKAPILEILESKWGGELTLKGIESDPLCLRGPRHEARASGKSVVICKNRKVLDRMRSLLDSAWALR